MSAVVFLIAFALVVYYAVTGTELVDDQGRTLDCGSIIAPSDSALAAGNCSGVNDGQVVGLIVSGAVALAAVALIVIRLVKENRGVHW